MSADLTVVRPHEAESVWVIRDRVRFMGEVPGTDLAVIEVEVPPGSGTPPHRHASPEVFHVLEGEITFGRFGDGPPRFVPAGPGTVASVPSRVPHQYQNTGPVPARMLVVIDRSMAAFFRDLGRAEAPPAGPPSDAEIAAVMAACARHDIQMLA